MLFLKSQFCPTGVRVCSAASPHSLTHGNVLLLESFIAVPLWPLLFHVPRSDGNLIY